MFDASVCDGQVVGAMSSCVETAPAFLLADAVTEDPTAVMALMKMIVVSDFTFKLFCKTPFSNLVGGLSHQNWQKYVYQHMH